MSASAIPFTGDLGEPASRARSPAALQRLVLVAFVPVVLGLMDWTYVHAIVARFGEVGYPGLPNESHGFALRLICWALATAPALWLPMRLTRPSQVLIWALYAMVLLPSAVVGVHARSGATTILTMMASTALGLGVMSVIRFLPPLRMPRVRVSRTLFWVGIGVFSVVSHVATYRTFGAIQRFVSLEDIYIQRMAWVEAAGNPIVIYMMAWQSLAVSPFLISYAIVARRPLLALLGVGSEIFFFSVGAQRSLLAVPLMIGGMYLIMRLPGRSFGSKMLLGTAAAFLIPVLGYGALPEVVSLSVDVLLLRLFINNGFLSALYFEYFSANPMVLFADVKPFSWFLTSPYGQSYKHALAWDVWGTFLDPNANLFADGYAQLHFVGVIIESIAMALTFWLIDSVWLQRRRGMIFAGVLLASQIPTITNGQLPNMLFGSGLLLVVLLLFFSPNPRPARPVPAPSP
jgi:hypothetical protein